MSTAQAIRSIIDPSVFVVKAYLEDLTDADLLVRPVEGANHIAWQLGHLIYSENYMVNAVCPGAMPPLPENFIERHSLAKASSDDPADFDTRARYIELMDQQRAATMLALETQSDEDLLRPAPESLRNFAPTVACVFGGQTTHWMMHAGQWAIVRRKLGRKHLF